MKKSVNTQATIYVEEREREKATTMYQSREHALIAKIMISVCIMYISS